VIELKSLINNVPDFPRPGIMFRDISPLLRDHFADIDVLAGIESRGFILGAALATRRGKGFVLVRKQGKLPPPVVDISYDLEYGSGVLEMQRGAGRVLLVDDVLATGGTMTASADLCVSAGYEIKALVALIDLKIIADYRWQGRSVRSAVNY
jgi:adenine phosphoribosyltransferase